jgi:RNA polymerase sigma-70 factor (ECF subfamily)
VPAVRPRLAVGSIAPEGSVVSPAVEPPAWRTHRFRELYDRSYLDLVAYCRRRIAPSAVDDVVAEAFLVAWQRLDDVTGDPRPWLFGVAHNLIRNRRRADARAEVLRDVLVTEIGTRQTDGDALDVDELRALIDALHGLKETDAELLRLTAWEGLSHADIAVVLGCSENAVAIRLHRARARLRTRLATDRRWTAGNTSNDRGKGSLDPAQVPVDGAADDPRKGPQR